jgi:hypoxanthine phosphoribosyltransferase
MHPDIKEILVDEVSIQKRVKELANQISADYDQAEEIIVIGVLKGAFIFLADLTRQLSIPHQVDFMAVSSYGNTATTIGAVRLRLDLKLPIENRHVLIVEDIIDTGYTLQYLEALLHTRRPASLRSCVLLSKPSMHKVQVNIDYLGFTIPDVWVVGYGLDYANTHRTLPYLGVLKPEVYQAG